MEEQPLQQMEKLSLWPICYLCWCQLVCDSDICSVEVSKCTFPMMRVGGIEWENFLYLHCRCHDSRWECVSSNTICSSCRCERNNDKNKLFSTLEGNPSKLWFAVSASFSKQNSLICEESRVYNRSLAKSPLSVEVLHLLRSSSHWCT